MKFRPLHDRVLVKRVDQEEKTAGWIILPDTAQERPQQGEVVATGPGRVLSNGKRIDMEIKPGDTVIYSKYAGTEIAVEAEDLLVMGSNDILAILS